MVIANIWCIPRFPVLDLFALVLHRSAKRAGSELTLGSLHSVRGDDRKHRKLLQIGVCHVLLKKMCLNKSE